MGDALINEKSNENSNLYDESQANDTAGEPKKSGFKKSMMYIVPIVILIFSFIVGFIYFFNIEVFAKYLIKKEGFPLDVDKLEIHLSGKFNVERFKYGFLNRQGVTDQIKMEYIGGSVSPLSMFLSKKLVLDVNLKGIKIPFESGLISGGSWKMIALLKNVSKNIQQWEGDVTLTAENAMIQYTIMNVNYVALIQSGKLKGHIKNSILQLETSEILTDIARITVTGNTTINYPYNVNVQLSMLPLDEFGKKYPEIKGMLSAVLQKDPNLVINLTGTLDKLNPQIKNLTP